MTAKTGFIPLLAGLLSDLFLSLFPKSCEKRRWDGKNRKLANELAYSLLTLLYSHHSSHKGGTVSKNVRLVAGITIIILGLLVAVTPRYIFPTCDYQSHDDASLDTVVLAQAGGLDGDTGAMTTTGGTSTGMGQSMSTTGDMDVMGTSTSMDGADEGSMAGMNGTMDENMGDDMAGMDMSGGHSPCYFTTRGAVALGLIIMLIGAAVIVASTADALRLLALVLGGTGVLVILTPTYLLPVCENPQMACHNGAEQLLIVLGALVLLVAAVMAAMAKDRPPVQS
jgi:hypothetical protein